MINGKYIRNLKNCQLSKEQTSKEQSSSSSSSQKIRAKYRYNLHLSSQKTDETNQKKNSNISTIENGEISKDNINNIQLNKPNDNSFNIAKTLTSFHSANKTEEKENKRKEFKDKDNKEKENNVENNYNTNKEIRKRMNFRERLNDSRKKRAFLNSNSSTKNNNLNINISINENDNDNNNNIDSNNKDNDKSMKSQNEEKNTNRINIKEEKKAKLEDNKYNNIIYKDSHSKKRKKRFEIIKKNNEIQEMKDNKDFKEKDNDNLNKGKIENAIKNNEKDIKEENLGNEIKDTVKCHICEQKMVHPKMCPKCHNISCEKCLYNWFLKDQNKECYYCKEPINFYEFISVPFMDTIVDFVEKVIYDRKKYSSSFREDYGLINNFKNEENNMTDNSFSMNDNCDIHESEKIYYYCLDCNKGYCKTCFVFFGNEKDKHLNHKIIEYSNYKKYNLPSLEKQKETIDLKMKYIMQLIEQYNSYKKMYEFQRKTINDYISFILEEYNNKMNIAMKNIDGKINELNQSLGVYQKTKSEIDEFYKKINIKNRFSTNTQFLIDKIEKINNKEIINEKEKNEILMIPENLDLKIYKSKSIDYNADNTKYLNKKIKIENEIEMIIDNKNKNCLNIHINILNNNQKCHFYKAIAYIIKKEENIINAYLIDERKGGKNINSFLKKIQLEENDFSLLEIKAIIYDMYFE